jgi:hypothetical protein
MPHGTQHLAARFQHHIGGVLFEILSEGVIGGQKVPAIEALLDGGEASHIGLAEGVEHIMNRIGAAGFVGEPDRAGAVEYHDLVARLCNLAGGERGGGRGDVEQHLDALIVQHVTGDVGGKVGLVLMIGRDDFDLAAQHFAAEILGRHFRGGLRARPGDIGIQAGHVENAAELERRLALRQRHRRRHRQNRGDNACCCSSHGGLPVHAPHYLQLLKFSARSCRMGSRAARRGRRWIHPCFPLSGMTAGMTRHG